MKGFEILLVAQVKQQHILYAAHAEFLRKFFGLYPPETLCALVPS